MSATKIQSNNLLGLGLTVVECRHRNKNKDLGPWVFDSAFVNPADAEWYYEEFKEIGYMRLLKPNSPAQDPE